MVVCNRHVAVLFAARGDLLLLLELVCPLFNKQLLLLRKLGLSLENGVIHVLVERVQLQAAGQVGVLHFVQLFPYNVTLHLLSRTIRLRQRTNPN